MKQKAAIFIFIFIFSLSATTKGQENKKEDSPYTKLGQKALMDGNFKVAVVHFEKALTSGKNNDPNVLYMLGYSYYHSGDYKKAISSFSQVISLRPNEVSAYYYRGKARNVLGAQMNSILTPEEREKLLQAGIRDYSKAIELNNQDIKLYQNRAIAYRDYGILKGQKDLKFYDKNEASNSFQSCISDFQKVLDSNPSRKDILKEIKKAKVYKENL